MGQYYYMYLKDPEMRGNTGVTVYNRDLDGEYTAAKLTEFSWIGNHWADSVVSQLYKKPMIVATVGDYADKWAEKNDRPDVARIHKRCWNNKAITVGVKYSGPFDYVGKYFCNHSKKEYLSYDEYREKSKTIWDGDGAEWLFHPIPLLTAIGNGLGGGDYSGPCKAYVGYWALDTISIEDENPEGHNKISVVFKENF